MRLIPMHAEHLLEVKDLRVTIAARAGSVAAVDGVDLTLAPGRRLGIVGESGAGKTQLALALVGLGARAATVTGSVRFAGQELVGADERSWRGVRGVGIGSVFQDPGTALAPHLRIGTQLTEVLAAHAAGSSDARDARRRALEMLEQVRIPDPARRLGQYPHELSGGLRQRVMLAMALIARPALVIADEPTTALDATVEAGILELFRELSRGLGTALVLVSHDLAVVAGLCDEIAVMYAGRIVETGPAEAVLGAPAHPYTRALVQSTLTLATPFDRPLVTIPGAPPALGAEAAGCRYAPRCPRAVARCVAQAPSLQVAGARQVACFRPIDGGEGA